MSFYSKDIIRKVSNIRNPKKLLTIFLPVIATTLITFQEKAQAVCAANEDQYKRAEELLNKNKNYVYFNKTEFEDFSILWYFNQLILILDYGNNSFVTQHTPYADIYTKITLQKVNAQVMESLGCLKYSEGTVDSINNIDEWNKRLLKETNEIEKLKILLHLSILYAQDPYQNLNGNMVHIRQKEQDIDSFYTYANELLNIINSNPEYTKKYQIILQTLKMFEVRLMGKEYNGLINGNPTNASEHHRNYAPLLLKSSTEGLPIIKHWLLESKESFKKTNSKDTLNNYVMRMEPYFDGFADAYYRLNNDPRFTSSVPAFYQMADDIIGIMLEIFDMYKDRNDDTEERNYVRLLQLFLEILPDHMEATINGYGSSQYFDQRTLNFATEAKQYLINHFKDLEKSGKYKINDQSYSDNNTYVTTTKSDLIASRASQLGINEFSNAIDQKMLAVIALKNWTPKDYHELELTIDGSNATTLPGAKHNFDQALSQPLLTKLGIHSSLVSQTAPYKRYSTEYGKDMWISARQYKISGSTPWQGKMVLHFDLTAKLYESHVNKFTTIIRQNQVMSPITFESIEMRERPEDFKMNIPESRYTMSNIQVTPN